MPRSGCSALDGVNPNKKKTTCGLNFWQIQNNWRDFGFLPQWEFFWKILLHRFLTLTILWLSVKFQKNPITCFWEKLLMNYWPTDRGSFIEPFPHKGRGPKTTRQLLLIWSNLNCYYFLFLKFRIHLKLAKQIEISLMRFGLICL